MKKLLTVTCICAGFALAGCSNDDDSTPTSQDFIIDARNVENGNSYTAQIDSVKAVVNYEEHYTPDDEFYATYDVFASTNYVNGGFMMTLPAKVDSKYLSGFYHPDFDDLTVSDMNAKYISIQPSEQIFASKSGKLTGKFFYGNRIDDNNRIYVIYVYVDRDVVINGSRTYEVGYFDQTDIFDNVILKKGWNEIYESSTHDYDTKVSESVSTNTKPNGLKWSFRLYE
ncbi:MAG: hypothetical protein LBK94_09705 [Prevotellaceae bacterium]|jgi:hypothetical protein|nr:hypothetical protein [Prevotellaceae bacterium]